MTRRKVAGRFAKPTGRAMTDGRFYATLIYRFGIMVMITLIVFRVTGG